MLPGQELARGSSALTWQCGVLEKAGGKAGTPLWLLKQGVPQNSDVPCVPAPCPCPTYSHLLFSLAGTGQSPWMLGPEHVAALLEGRHGAAPSSPRRQRGLSRGRRKISHAQVKGKGK